MMIRLEEYKEYMEKRGFTPISIKNAQWRLGFFIKFLRLKDCTEITRQVMEDYAYYLRTEYVSPLTGKGLGYSSIKSRLNAARAYLKWAVDKGDFLFNPAFHVRTPKDIRPSARLVPSQKEIAAFLDSLETTTYAQIRNKAVFELIYSCGLRAKELLGLDIYDLDFSFGKLHVRKGKGMKDRFLPVGRTAIQAVQFYLENARPFMVKGNKYTEALFVSGMGNRLTYKMLGWNFRDRRGTARFTIHAMRHACAVGMLQNGADLRYIQVMLGHKDVNTTQVYLQATLVDLQRVIKKYHPRAHDNQVQYVPLEELKKELAEELAV